MKIFEVTLRNGEELKYIYCKLNNIQDLSPDADFFNSYLDCKENKDKITKEKNLVLHIHISQALKKYCQK
jgi:hypothetical protein